MNLEKGKRYKNHNLRDVIFRLDYAPILQIYGNNKEIAEDFRKKVFDKFPNVSFKMNTEINFEFNSDTGMPENSNKEDNLSWIFTNDAKNHIVELNPNYLILHYKNKSYLGFKDFFSDILIILNALEIYLPIKLRSAGLRYVNQIDETKAKDFDKYIASSLSNKIAKDFEENEELIQIFTELNLKKNDYILSLKYGLFNPEFPNPKDNKDFILDYDCRLNNLNTLDDLKEDLKNMNKFIYEKFENSITDELRKEMSGED